MALSAVEPRPRFAPALAELLAPAPGRLAFAARIALICALTALIVEIYQIPDPALPVYLVFFLNHDNRAGSVVLDIVLMIVIAVVVGIALALSATIGDVPMWRVIGMAVVSFGLLFLGSASKLRPLASTMALIVGYALDLVGTVQMGELITRALLYVLLFVGIPAAVSLVVNLILAPSPRRLAEAKLAEGLRLAAAALRTQAGHGEPRPRALLAEGPGEIEEWLKLAGVEQTSSKADLAALAHARLSLIVLLSAIDVAETAALPVPLRARLTDAIDAMAAVFAAGGYPSDAAPDLSADLPPLSPLASQAAAAIAAAIRQFAHVVAEKPAPPEPAAKGGFFLPDAFTNPGHVLYALKTTIAAMFCFVLFSLLDWPGIHTCFLTCYIVALTTAAESVEKLTLRLAGAMVGAAIGTLTLVFVMPALTSIGSLMIVIFLGALGSGYVAAGSPRIAYAGFQIAFAFFLCVVQGSGPAFDMATARDRVIGILLGNLVMYIVSTRLWPVSIVGRIDPTIARVLRQLSAMMEPGGVGRSAAHAARAATGLREIETDLDLARYEPAHLAEPETWIAARRAVVDEIADLASPLVLAAESKLEGAGMAADSLRVLADRVEEGDADIHGSDRAPDAGAPAASLLEIVDRHLERLEAMMLPRAEDVESDTPHALA